MTIKNNFPVSIFLFLFLFVIQSPCAAYQSSVFKHLPGNQVQKRSIVLSNNFSFEVKDSYKITLPQSMEHDLHETVEITLLHGYEQLDSITYKHFQNNMFIENNKFDSSNFADILINTENGNDIFRMPLQAIKQGDIVEISVEVACKPLIPGEFWTSFEYSNVKSELQLSTPLQLVLFYQSNNAIIAPQIIEAGDEKTITGMSCHKMI